MNGIASIFVTLSGLKTGSGQWLCFWESLGKSHLGYFLGLRPLRALRDLELDLLTLFESLEAVALNGAVVNEDVGRAGLLDEPVAL
jgi:hypothetical protein